MFFPYSTDRDLERVPWATISLIAVNVLCLLCWLDPALLERLILNPEAFGIWQLLTSMFMHGGIMHLAGNMVFLWVFGSHVEDTIGIPKYLLLYFSAGLGAEALQSAADLGFLHALRPSLGASGAIMGLVALFCTRFRKVNVNFWYLIYFRAGTFAVRAMWVAIFYMVLNVGEGVLFGVMGVGGGVAFFAHIGGFLTGLAWSYGLRLPEAAMAEEQTEAARTLAAAGAYETAAASLETALERTPNDPELHRQAAQYLGAREKTRGRAAEHWDAALRLWLREGKVEEALTTWERLQGTYQPAQFSPATLMALGRALESGGWIGQAAAVYQGIVQGHPQRTEAPAAALRLARLAAAAGRPDTARQWCEYLCKRWPECYEALEAGERLRA
jgi:membrane associated rhomboid family serine protease